MMQPITRSVLRVVRWVGVTFILVSIIPARRTYDWWSVLFTVFGVSACIPYSQLRTRTVFWSFFSLYVLSTVLVAVNAVTGWIRFGHLEVVPVICMFNMIVQPVFILWLRHDRRVVQNNFLEPSAVNALSSATRSSPQFGGASGPGRSATLHITGTKIVMEQIEDKMSRQRLYGFWLANACVAIFFDGFWLLGYRIATFDRLSEAMGKFQFVIWFLSFFLVSFIYLKGSIKKHFAAKCCGIASVFCCALFLLLGISTMMFGPFLDPWY